MSNFYSKYQVLISGLGLLTLSCGTMNPNILTIYKNNVREHSNGITFKSKNKLILYTDSTYRQKYVHSDGEGGLSMNENGTYEIIEDTLILNPEVEILNFKTKYLIRNKRLYNLNYKNEDEWILK